MTDAPTPEPRFKVFTTSAAHYVVFAATNEMVDNGSFELTAAGEANARALAQRLNAPVVATGLSPAEAAFLARGSNPTDADPGYREAREGDPQLAAFGEPVGVTGLSGVAPAPEPTPEPAPETLLPSLPGGSPAPVDPASALDMPPLAPSNIGYEAAYRQGYRDGFADGRATD